MGLPTSNNSNVIPLKRCLRSIAIQRGYHRDVDQFAVEFTHDEGFGKSSLHRLQLGLSVAHRENRLRDKRHRADWSNFCVTSPLSKNGVMRSTSTVRTSGVN